MDKYIQSMKQVCADIEAQESYEDEQFIDELDEALGFNEGKKLFACCGCRDGWCAGCVPDETLLEE